MIIEHWCRITIITFVLQIFFTPMFSQSFNKADYVWLLSGPELDSLLIMDFNNEPGVVKLRTEGLNLNTNNASISDENGELLFYSNGCAVADRNHEIMPNGHEINDGSFFELFWLDDCYYGYPGLQDILIIPDPKHNDGYYIIHKTVEYEPDLDPSFFIRYLKYSYVDMTLNNGNGDVTIKNKIFFDSRFLASYLTGISHSNEKDWWIIQPKENSNTYYKILLDSTGFTKIDSQSIGNKFDSLNASASGDAKFSPDGTMYAYFNLHDGLFLFEFNRENGELSNFRHLDNLRDSVEYELASVEFSPNSRFIYLAATDSLWQVDTWVDNLEDGKVLIDFWNGNYDPLPTHFADALLGPDCKIYIRPHNVVRSMHVINYPNKKGKASNFQQQVIPIPTTLNRGTFPNFPRFRVDEEYACDSTLTSVSIKPEIGIANINVYPNPTTGLINFNSEDRYNLKIYNYLGECVYSENRVGEDKEINIFHYPPGMYLFQFEKDGKYYIQKIIKTD